MQQERNRRRPLAKCQIDWQRAASRAPWPAFLLPSQRRCQRHWACRSPRSVPPRSAQALPASCDFEWRLLEFSSCCPKPRLAWPPWCGAVRASRRAAWVSELTRVCSCLRRVPACPKAAARQVRVRAGWPACALPSRLPACVLACLRACVPRLLPRIGALTGCRTHPPHTHALRWGSAVVVVGSCNTDLVAYVPR